jgi:dTDP-4-amino-4,6-dideoxygalactose transaminase
MRGTASKLKVATAPAPWPAPASEPIPFNRFCKTGTEFEYIQRAIDCMHISGDGQFTARCSEYFESHIGVCKALLTTSCTHALEMAALLLDIKPGDEVIVPSFTFVSTVNAFVLRGALPVFVDIRPDTLNMDERLLACKITPRTRAIVPVHYAGVGCEMDAIMSIADAARIPVVEDNAHGLFGNYRGRNLGTFGCMSTLSFHETKNITCGEGGALLINDERLIERAEILREKGTNRKRFFRGEVDKYTWVDQGSSYLPSEILAAVLYAQLESSENIQTSRARVWNTYERGLRSWGLKNGIGLPFVPEYCAQAYHMFYLMLPSEGHRQALIAHLKARGIHSVFHYVPLHLSEMGRKFGGREGDCPVTENLSSCLLRLPFYNGLAEERQQRVIDALLAFSD